AEWQCIRLWDVASGEEKRDVRTPNCGARSLVFAPDSKLLAHAENFDVVLRNANTGNEVRRLVGHRETVNRMTFSPDGKTLASAGHDQAVRLWDLATGKEKLHADEPSGRAIAAHFTPDGKHVVVGTKDHWLRVWDAETGALVRRFGRDDFRT